MCWNVLAPLQKVFTNQLGLVIGHHLVEDMVASFIGKLECHSRLLQQICQRALTVTIWPNCGSYAPPWALLTCLNISTGQFAGCAKMNSDEFTLLMETRTNMKGTKGRAVPLRKNHWVLTKREELSFLTVLALPYASRRGLAAIIWSSREPYNPVRSDVKGLSVSSGHDKYKCMVGYSNILPSLIPSSFLHRQRS